MTRIDELQKRYPSIPRDVIIEQDVIVQGVRDGEDLDKASTWQPALGLYQTTDYDMSAIERAEKAPHRVRPGLILRPGVMRFKSGVGAHIRLRSTSPYAVKEVKEGKFALFEGEEKVEDVYFFRPKPRTTPEPVSSKGTPISRLIEFKPSCFQMAPVRYCEYFSQGLQCKFCNLNASYDQARSAGLPVFTTANLEETVEALKIRSAEVRQCEGLFVGGGFAKSERETTAYLAFFEQMAGVASPKPSFSLHAQAMERQEFQRLKDVGLDCFAIQLEVMHPQLFAEVCPGKAKHMPYERWIEAFHDAVDVFGVGKVACKLVPGVTLFPPNGHKTWQEARDYNIEADKWMIKNGVFSHFHALWWAPGSVYSEDKSNIDKFPPSDYHLDVALANHETMMEHGLYEKMNKFMLCGLDCTVGSYIGEIGMLTLAGDVGNWMADVVPPESNWLAKFIASVRNDQ